MTQTQKLNSLMEGHDSQSANAARPTERSRTSWAWLIAAVLALFYPATLGGFHDEFSRHGGTFLAWVQLGGAYLVPVSGLICAFHLQAQGLQSARQLLSFRLSHLAVAVPPAFTLIGVMLYLMRINDLDGAVWAGLWTAVALGSVMLVATSGDNAAARYHLQGQRYLRACHGIAALLVLLVFLGAHLANHASALFGTALHTSIMHSLRKVYRQALVEKLVILLFFFQIVSGAVLLRHKTKTSRDWIDTLQTTSGVYLMVFIAGHINSVFTLARRAGTETDFAWATSQPTGLLLDGWTIRLLPHYSLAVLFVGCHLACGLRTILVKHGVAIARACRVTTLCVLASAILALAIAGSLLGLRLNGVA